MKLVFMLEGLGLKINLDMSNDIFLKKTRIIFYIIVD